MTKKPTTPKPAKQHDLTELFDKPLDLDIRHEEVRVTPELASKWLGSNSKYNRSVSRAAIERYAADMRAGEWRLSHQGIAFDKEGVLIDGQHRLHAVVLSNASVPMTVFFYEGAQPPLGVFDGGSRRTNGNALEMEGLVTRGCGKRASAIAVALYKGLGDTSGSPSRGEVFSIYAAHKRGIDWAIETIPVRFVAPIQAAFAYAYPCAPDEIAVMAKTVRGRVGMAEGSGEIMLDRLGESMRGKLISSDTSVVFIKSLRAIQAAIEGTKMVKLMTAKSHGSDATSQVLQWFQKKRRAIGLIDTAMAAE